MEECYEKPENRLNSAKVKVLPSNDKRILSENARGWERALQSELSFWASPSGVGGRDSEGPPFESGLSGRMLREAWKQNKQCKDQSASVKRRKNLKRKRPKITWQNWQDVEKEIPHITSRNWKNALYKGPESQKARNWRNARDGRRKCQVFHRLPFKRLEQITKC